MTTISSLGLFCIISTILLAVVASFLPIQNFCDSLEIVKDDWRPLIPATIFQLVQRPLCLPAPSLDVPAWNLFYHLGGNGPWIEKTDAKYGTYNENGKPPPGCVVDQVHLLSRHAERYPTKNAGARHLSLLARLQPYVLNGSLSFLNDDQWTYFASPLRARDGTFDDLTAASPYAGTLSAFKLGTTLRSRYSHLLAYEAEGPTSLWSASSPRDVETARYFADGLFGRDWALPNATNPASLHIIPETEERGSNTLTPSDTCTRYIHDKVSGHDKGYHKLAEWQRVFTRPISARLSAANPAIDPALSPLEVYGMMELCGFETLVRGDSPWCGIFSQAEWLDFEYARDLLHYYRAGPGNRYAAAMGSLWLNSTNHLLAQESKLTDHRESQGSAPGELYAAFVHDSDIVPVIAALGVLGEESPAADRRRKSHNEDDLEGLPATHRKDSRLWRTSDIVPMLGHLIIERLNCHTPQGWPYRDVRLFLNDGWMGLPVPVRSTSSRETSATTSPAAHPENLEQMDMPEPPPIPPSSSLLSLSTPSGRVFIPQMELRRFVDMIKPLVVDADGRSRFGTVCGVEETEKVGEKELEDNMEEQR